MHPIDRATGRWRHFIHRPDDPSSLSHNMVRTIVGDRDGGLWIDTSQAGGDRSSEVTT
jgi:hypothetical protein